MNALGGRGGSRRVVDRIAVALVATTTLVITAVYAAVGPPLATVELDIAKFAFGPKEVTVAPGTKVVWTNHDEAPHTVASEDGSFVSKGLDTDDRFEHTFTREGDYPYVCSVHPFMKGVVHVRRN